MQQKLFALLQPVKQFVKYYIIWLLDTLLFITFPFVLNAAQIFIRLYYYYYNFFFFFRKMQYLEYDTLVWKI